MRRGILAAIALSMTLMCACGEETVSAPPLNDSISVVYDTVAVERGDVVAKLVYDAYIMPTVTEAKFTGASGYVDKVFFSVGDEVSQGDALLKLDTSSVEERLEDAKESLQALTGGRELERRLLEMDLELAQLKLEEIEEQGSATETELAGLDVERCKTALDDYDAQYSKRLAAAQKNISQLEEELEACTLRAPADGRVASMLPVGSYASAATVAATVASEEGRYICYDGTSSIPQGKYTYAVLNGEEKELERYEYTDRELAAQRSQSLPKRFLPTDGSELPESGTYIQIIVERERSNDTLRLPVNAVTYDSGVNYVYLIVNGEKVYTEVKAGVTSNAYVEILDGLSEGDMVYVGK